MIHDDAGSPHPRADFWSTRLPGSPATMARLPARACRPVLRAPPWNERALVQGAATQVKSCGSLTPFGTLLPWLKYLKRKPTVLGISTIPKSK